MPQSAVQSASEFLSVAPVSSSATQTRGAAKSFGVSSSRTTSAATHERPAPTYRIPSENLSTRPFSNMYINRSNTMLNVTGVGVNGPSAYDEFDRLAASSSAPGNRAPATALGIARMSVGQNFVTSSHGTGR